MFKPEYATILIIILILGLSAIYKPVLFTAAFQRRELFQSIMLWLPLIVTVAMGMMMVITTGCIDVSVGSIVGATGMFVGFLFKFYDAPFWVGVLAAIVFGMMAGAFNGLFISYLGINFLVVTLATMNIWRGFAFIITDGVEISGFYMPEQMSLLILKGPIPGIGIPWLIWITVFFVIIMVFFMKYSHFGREVYAVGSNENAAKLRGINVKKVRFLVFTLTGMFSGIAGLMYGARFGFFSPGDTGNGMELIIIASTVIGGVSISGGRGSIIGAVLGCLLIGIVQTLIPSLGFSSFYNTAIYGLIIIIALIIDRGIKIRQSRGVVAKKGVVGY
ncbi:L-arabinose transport system permease protein AraH [subsurface metagenome]